MDIIFQHQKKKKGKAGLSAIECFSSVNHTWLEFYAIAIEA